MILCHVYITVKSLSKRIVVFASTNLRYIREGHGTARGAASGIRETSRSRKYTHCGLQNLSYSVYKLTWFAGLTRPSVYQFI